MKLRVSISIDNGPPSNVLETVFTQTALEEFRRYSQQPHIRTVVVTIHYLPQEYHSKSMDIRALPEGTVLLSMEREL
jgi:hypothetical protein